MKRYFVKESNINQSKKKLFIVDEEFNHAKNVIRQKIGDKIICFSGDGNEYFCKVKEIKNNQMHCIIEKQQISAKTPLQNLTLFQGSLKNNNFELVIQKAAEIGLKAIIPFESSYSVAKIKPEKLQRFQKISQSASKQCTRADIMQVEE